MSSDDYGGSSNRVLEGEFDDLRARAAAVCQRLLGEQGHDLSPSANAVAEALAAFAQAGLMELASFGEARARIEPADLRRMSATIETLARQSGTLASIYMVNVILGGALIVLCATAEQKSVMLPKLQAGQLQLAFAMTEAQAGSDAASLTTTATRQGDVYLLNGEKLYTTGAATADWVVVVARAASDTSAKRALSLFLVPRNAPGLTVEVLPKLSAGAHASCRVQLDNVRVTSDRILGGVDRLGAAWNVLRATGSLERLVVAAMSLGLATSVVERATTFAKSRQQFGRTIAGFQAIQHMLVDMRIIETGMRLFVQQALAALEQGGEATTEVCMAKCFCSEKLQDIVAMGVRVMGGRSYFEFEPMARYYREAPFTLFAGGTVEIQKMLIARAMTLG